MAEILRESQFLCDGFAIDREIGTGNCAGTQRQNIDALERLLKPFRVAAEHFAIRETVVAPSDRLRAPQMRVCGNDDVGISLRRIRSSASLKRFEIREDQLDCLAHKQAEIGRDLIVAAAARMKLSGGRSDL